MKPYWNNWGDFFSMGGYGLYVWSAFGMVALVVAIELWGLHQRRAALAELEDETT